MTEERLKESKLTYANGIELATGGEITATISNESIEMIHKLVDEAEAKANELKKKTLTKDIIMQEFISKWNGELPKVSSSNSYFDISKILGE